MDTEGRFTFAKQIDRAEDCHKAPTTQGILQSNACWKTKIVPLLLLVFARKQLINELPSSKNATKVASFWGYAMS